MRVTRQSYGSKLISSVIGAILGIVLFLGSFVVLYINEGREDLSKIAMNAEVITQQENNLESGSLVFIKGNLDTSNYVSDDYLTNDNYIFITRAVEMYAYVEKEHKESEDNLGGSTTTVTTYTYEKKWTKSPNKSTTFRGDDNEVPTDIPEGYNTWIEQKPSDNYQKASDLNMGDYSVGENVSFSGSKTLNLTQDNTETDDLDNPVVMEKYLYNSFSEPPAPTSPSLGDIRISYKVLTSEDTGMLLGAVDGNDILAYITPKNNKLFRFFAEADSKAEAVLILESEHKTTTWILRLVGWFMMFAGLLAMTGPVTKFLSVIPFFSRISGFIFAVAAFFISIVLSALTILLSIILQNFWLAVALIILVILIIIFVIRSKRKKALSSSNQRR
ncbi:MAG: TMEM43 family protein [Bacillota bacterium]